MKNRIIIGILFSLMLVSSAVFGYVAENSRQGVVSVFEEITPGDDTPNSFSDAGEQGKGIENNRRTILSNRNRYYSPRVGRFVSRDPIGFNGGLNLWGYCGNNPVNNLDSFGLKWLARWLKWAYTVTDYDRTKKSSIPIYNYFTSDFSVTRFDFWHFENYWVPDSDPCATETTLSTPVIPGVSLRYTISEKNPPGISLAYPWKRSSSTSYNWNNSGEKFHLDTGNAYDSEDEPPLVAPTSK